MHLAGADSAFSQSRVFVKRNHLFTELKQVLISVELCASLFLLEDFLRNRVKTIDDVKTLRSQLGGGSYGVAADRESALSNPNKREIFALLEKTIVKMREVLDISKPYIDAELKDFNT